LRCHSDEEGVSWHSDGEKYLKREGAIASLSFGAARRFCFKHKRTKEKAEQVLDHGSLLVMKGQTQQKRRSCSRLNDLPRQTVVLGVS